MEYGVRRGFVPDSGVVAHAYSTLRSLPKPVGWNRRALHKHFGFAWDSRRAVFHAKR
uniref:Uncharacterized protein n=1 Tax=Candidatus Kentrum sp. LFY TaxID=2126342 RepID=A0A450VGR6_9GAMM|nr:MAG: hypothetical protein BECKLFY1418A_GA0070994_13341 [Candidatus Kentron sp. LFY]